MEVKAVHKYAKVSAQKARLVADVIRGMKVDKALDNLEFSTKKSASLFKKVLNSAISNAENNNGLDIDNLYVTTVYVDQASTMKRMRARAKGRGNRILKQTSHITLFVGEV